MENRGFSLFTAGSREVTATRDCESVKPEETLGWLLELGRAWRVLERRLRRTPKKQPHPNTSEVGRFLRKRHVLRYGQPQSRTARRSVPTEEVLGLLPRVLRQTRPHPNTSEVGRFLRKRHVLRYGQPQSRTARRSVPTEEVLGRRPAGQKPTVSDGVKTNETCRFKNH